MRKPSVELIIKKYLKRRLKDGLDTVKSSDIETSLVQYGRDYWGVSRLPNTYSRAWRKLRESNGSLLDIDVTRVKLLEREPQGKWKLETLTSKLQQVAQEIEGSLFP